jgi:hypothetical protein
VTEENRRGNVAIEVALGNGALASAELLLEAGQLRDAVSRAYYAAHHYARAALLTLGVEARSHEALRSLFGEHLVKPGHVPRASSRALSRLQRMREDADYERYFELDRAGADEEVAVARQFVTDVGSYLTTGGWLRSV